MILILLLIMLSATIPESTFYNYNEYTDVNVFTSHEDAMNHNYEGILVNVEHAGFFWYTLSVSTTNYELYERTETFYDRIFRQRNNRTVG